DWGEPCIPLSLPAIHAFAPESHRRASSLSIIELESANVDGIASVVHWMILARHHLNCPRFTNLRFFFSIQLAQRVRQRNQRVRYERVFSQCVLSQPQYLFKLKFGRSPLTFGHVIVAKV